MKIRNGFVSNSSSSSFVVIDRYNKIPKTQLDTYYIIGDDGECEFGWDITRYEGIDTKINFAYLQAQGNPKWMTMLCAVLAKHGVEEFDCVLTTGYGNHGRFAYIDHQSAACEGENTEIFDSQEDLERFIFCDGSYIQGGNDNV